MTTDDIVILGVKTWITSRLMIAFIFPLLNYHVLHTEINNEVIHIVILYHLIVFRLFRHDIFVDLQYNKFLEQSKSEEGLQLWADIKVALRKQIEEKPISLSGI